MLAFGLVDADKRADTFNAVQSRIAANGSQPQTCETPPRAHPQGRWPSPADGVPGNVYSAFFALQALFAYKEDGGVAAVKMLSSKRKNSWLAMIADGATTTKEAWNSDEKPNLTWSHPWYAAASAGCTCCDRSCADCYQYRGASPALWLPYGILGIAFDDIGAASVRIRPQLGSLRRAACTVPTVRGPLSVAASASEVTLAVPATMKALVWQACGSSGHWISVVGQLTMARKCAAEVLKSDDEQCFRVLGF